LQRWDMVALLNLCTLLLCCRIQAMTVISSSKICRQMRFTIIAGFVWILMSDVSPH
jgi:hypothetical protein